MAGVVQSAFGFSGQKCSACSRAIVEEPIYDAFVDGCGSGWQKLKVGRPNRQRDMGPVVNEGAMKTIRELHRDWQNRKAAWSPAATLSTRRIRATSSSRPSLRTLRPTARIAQEEIFGPVLAVIKARDFEDALAIANNTEFGLTGSIYSRTA